MRIALPPPSSAGPLGVVAWVRLAVRSVFASMLRPKKIPDIESTQATTPVGPLVVLIVRSRRVAVLPPMSASDLTFISAPPARNLRLLCVRRVQRGPDRNPATRSSLGPERPCTILVLRTSGMVFLWPRVAKKIVSSARPTRLIHLRNVFQQRTSIRLASGALALSRCSMFKVFRCGLFSLSSSLLNVPAACVTCNQLSAMPPPLWSVLSTTSFFTPSFHLLKIHHIYMCTLKRPFSVSSKPRAMR